MKQIPCKSWYSIAIYVLYLCIFTIGLILIGSTDLYAKSHEEFKVVLLLPASITDGGWNALAYEGLKAIEKELGAKISHVESRTPTDQEAHFRDYALNGYQLIFGHGYEYQDPAKEVAPDFPETVFIASSGGTITDNISPMIFGIIDFIFPNADVAGLGAFQAVEAAQADGKVVYTFGTYRDQSEMSPTTILANAIITPKVFVHVAKAVMEGTFKPQPYVFTMGTDEAITFVYNPALKDQVPEAARNAVAEAKAKILAGALEVPRIDFTEKEKE